MKFIHLLIILLTISLLSSCLDFAQIKINLSKKETTNRNLTYTYQDIIQLEKEIIQILPSEEFDLAENFKCFYDFEIDGTVLQNINCNEILGVSFDSLTGKITWDSNLLKDRNYELLLLATSSGNPVQKIISIELLKDTYSLIKQPALYHFPIPSSSQSSNGHKYSCKFQNITCTGLSISQDPTTGTLHWDVPESLTEGIYSFQIRDLLTNTLLRTLSIEIKYGKSFISEWKITNPGETIYLPISDLHNNITYNYDFIVDWGDGTFERITSANPLPSHTYALSSLGEPDGVYRVEIKGIIELFSFHFFGSNDPTNTSKDKIIRVIEFGDLGWSYMMGAFRYASELLSFHGGNLSSAEFVSFFFADTNKLHTVDISSWTIPHVKSLKALFYNTISLDNLVLGNLNTSKVESLENLFHFAKKIPALNLNLWDVSAVKNMYATFAGMDQLTEIHIEDWQTQNVTNIDFLFWTTPLLNHIDLNKWNTGNLKTMIRAFQYTSAQQILISNWNTQNLELLEKAFYSNPNLNTLDVSGWDTSKLRNMSFSFYSLPALLKLDLSQWNTSAVETFSNAFYLSSGATLHVNLGHFEMDSVIGTNNIASGSGNIIIYCSLFSLPVPDNVIANKVCLDPSSF